MDYSGITVAEKLRKDELQTVVLSSLFDQGVLQGSEKGVREAQLGPSPGSWTAAPHTAGLTFEQQKELLTLQFEQDKLRRQETLELERLRQSTERMKLELEQSRLQFICEGRLSSGSAASAIDSDFEPFIVDAFVSLAGSDKKVPIKLLRDTGGKH